jgi:hypothetical protein
MSIFVRHILHKYLHHKDYGDALGIRYIGLDFCL